MYKEDVDLSWRFRLAGWECWYVPSAVASRARTSHGLAGKPYLDDLGAFHENEKRKPIGVRINSMKNQWLMLVKNEDLCSFARDLLYIAGREALVLGHNFVFNPRDAVIAVSGFMRGVPRVLRGRQDANARRTAEPSHIRRWFVS
jgi:hypothetical protein